MNDRPKPFIPSWLDDLGLSSNEFRLYCHLCRRAGNETGIAYPSAETATAVCGIARNTFWKTIAKLETLGLVKRLGKKFGSSNRYQVLAPIGANGIPIEAPIVSIGIPIEDDANRISFAPSIVSDLSHQSAQSATHQSAQLAYREGYPSKDIQGSKSIEVNPSIELFESMADFPQKKISAKELNQLAETIYQEYPRKVAKKPGLAAIIKAMKSNAPEMLLEKVKEFASASKGKESRFIPHPATWFNEERFDDDPAEWRQPAAGNQKPPTKVNLGGRSGCTDIDGTILDLPPS